MPVLPVQIIFVCVWFSVFSGATRDITLAHLQRLNPYVVEFLSVPVENQNMQIPYWMPNTNKVAFHSAVLSNSKYSCHVAFYITLPLYVEYI